MHTLYRDCVARIALKSVGHDVSIKTYYYSVTIYSTAIINIKRSL